MPFLLFTNYNSLHPPMGCTHQTLYFIYLPIKLASFKNLIDFAQKHSNLAVHGIYVLCNIKYSIASGGHNPPDPLLQRYNFRISPSPQQILDPPLNRSKFAREHGGFSQSQSHIKHGFLKCYERLHFISSQEIFVDKLACSSYKITIQVSLLF